MPRKTMTAAQRQALEKSGWRFGDAADFLGLTDQERQLLDARGKRRAARSSAPQQSPAKRQQRPA